jgi:hypothetical protein
MEVLLEQLLERWEQAFDELETFSANKELVKGVQYPDGLPYDLTEIDENFFPEWEPMANEGRFTYQDTFVEFVKFNLDTRVPSVLKRMEFQDGKKISFQSIVINGSGAPAFSQMSKEEIINQIRNDGYSMISTVTRYEYGQTGRIEKSFSIHIAPGLGKYTSYDVYTYGEDQVLDAIRTFFEQGTNRITYSRIPEDMTPETLVDTFSAALAESIAKALEDQPPAQPIALLELSYHYADVYIPSLVCQSAQKVAERIANKDFPFIPDDYYSALKIETKPLEHFFAQLDQMMKEDANAELGRKTLRKAASILTRNKLFGKLEVTEDFAAYALDWSVEGYDDANFEEILVECGVEQHVISKWRKSGMLRD